MDNDGDGLTDSVWVDLGYPARRNAQGQLYKPLFSFMVIGLNGRIPLNTAGNLAGGGPGSGGYHAAHLGNSVSEIDPTYGLQNGFVTGLPGPPSLDDLYAFTPPVLGGPANPVNGQVDNSSTTAPCARRPADPASQLARRHAAADEPVASRDLTGQINGDNNFVMFNGSPYFMPNGIADIGDVDGYGSSPPNAVLRLTPPVAGRWGEAQSVPGYPTIPNQSPPPPYLNLVVSSYSTPNSGNRIRAATRWTPAISSPAPPGTPPTTITTRSIPTRRFPSTAGWAR